MAHLTRMSCNLTPYVGVTKRVRSWIVLKSSSFRVKFQMKINFVIFCRGQRVEWRGQWRHVNAPRMWKHFETAAGSSCFGEKLISICIYFFHVARQMYLFLVNFTALFGTKSFVGINMDNHHMDWVKSSPSPNHIKSPFIINPVGRGSGLNIEENTL